MSRPRSLSARLLVLALAVGCGGPQRDMGARAEAEEEEVPERLGEHIRPVSARLTLQIDPRREGFTGEVEYQLRLARPTRAVWLHQEDLEISDAKLTVEGYEVRSQLDIEPERQVFGLRLAQAVGPIDATLTISFRGRFRGKNGLFRQQEGEEWYAFTDFEPDDARAAFPSFDEPSFKTRWTVRIDAPEGMLAFSNMPLAGEEPIEGGVRHSFEPTRPMSSYLVAAAVGRFQVVDGPVQPVPVRAILPQGRDPALTQTAFEVTPVFLRILEEYTGIRTPYPKVDFVAVPQMSGAMENPGLITYSASILLLDRQGASRRDLLLTVGVVAHELAHLWFGDLVTMSWWDGLWLNEGFATWMSDKLVARWDPAAGGEILDIADKRTALAADRFEDVRSLGDVPAPSDLSGVFDSITYRKGGALITMLEGWLGEDTFRAVVRDYLRSNQDGVVDVADLRASLVAKAGEASGRVLDAFHQRPGAPLVEIETSCTGGVLRLQVSRKLLSGRTGGYASWPVPVCLRAPGQAGASRFCRLLEGETAEWSLSGCPSWVAPNDGETGYYVYTLEPALAEALASANAINQRERVGLAESIRLQVLHDPAAARRHAKALAALLRSRDPYVTEVVAEVLQLSWRRGGEHWDATLVAVDPVLRSLTDDLGTVERPGEAEAARLVRPILITLRADLADDGAFRARIRADMLEGLSGDLSAVGSPSTVASLLAAAAVDGDDAFHNALRSARSSLSRPYRDAARAAALATHDPKRLRQALSDLLRQAPRSLIYRFLAQAAADPATREVVRERLFGDGGKFLAGAGDAHRTLLVLAAAELCSGEDSARVRRAFADHPALTEVTRAIRECAAGAR